MVLMAIMMELLHSQAMEEKPGARRQKQIALIWSLVAADDMCICMHERGHAHVQRLLAKCHPQDDESKSLHTNRRAELPM